MIKWIDPKCYQHYSHVVDLIDCFIDDYSDWKKVYDPVKDTEKFNDRFKTGNDIGWMTQSIINNKIVNIKNASLWPRSIKQMKFVEGVVNCYVNFIMPFKIVPLHKDDYYEKNIIDNPVYGSVIGISMPSSDPSVVGFEVGGEIKGWPTGGIVSFDGNVLHSGWNYTNEIRVTALLDIEQKYWRLN